MVINNKKTSVAVQKRKLIFIIGLTTIIVLLLSLDIFQDRVFGLTKMSYVEIFIIIYLIYYCWGIVRDYHYVYYSDLGAKIIFRYYSLSPLNKSMKSIEIDKSSFHNFQIERRLLGSRKYVILYQITNTGLAKYPPVSISLLKKSEREELKASLKMFEKLKGNN
jgi:hypothetical protein